MFGYVDSLSDGLIQLVPQQVPLRELGAQLIVDITLEAVPWHLMKIGENHDCISEGR